MIRTCSHYKDTIQETIDTLIIGIGCFADNRYQPISTLALADCRLHSW